ncbi:MAG: ABC transporter substrate-binding protein [Pseudomonadota bacterium]
MPKSASSNGTRWSRRSLLKAGAVVFAAPALPRALMAQTQTPKRGGHLIMALEGASASDSINPLKSISTFQNTINLQWGNCLVELGSDGKAKPELAESWEPNKTATSWTFKLRKGVQFQNGKEMDAADVVYSLGFHHGKGSTSPVAAFLTTLKEIRASGTHEITVEFNEPNADAPFIFTDHKTLIIPQGASMDRPVGTGPYIIDSYQPGVKVLAKRNPNYWKEGAAFADSIETIGINDATARLGALQSGAAHFINRVDPKLVPAIRSGGALDVIEMPSSAFYYYPIQVDKAPYDNKDFRLALKYALDREKMIKLVLGGFGQVGNDQPVSPLDPFFSKDVPQRPHDPEKAAFHLKQSGVTRPIEVAVAEASFPNAEAAVALFQEDCRAAGLDLQIKRVPSDGYWSDVWGKVPFCGSYSTGRPCADMTLSMGFLSSAAWNDSNWKRPDFDKVVNAARAELDEAKRKQLYHEAQLMIHDDCGMILPVFNSLLFGSATNVKGMVPTPVYGGYRISEQLYFA